MLSHFRLERPGYVIIRHSCSDVHPYFAQFVSPPSFRSRKVPALASIKPGRAQISMQNSLHSRETWYTSPSSQEANPAAGKFGRNARLRSCLIIETVSTQGGNPHVTDSNQSRL